jgi:aminoglycoside phosphotransferase (APT) family kinase protein
VAELDIAVRWVESVWQRVRAIQSLRGGVTSTIAAVTGVDGDVAVLRLMTEEPWRRHAEGLLAREAQVQVQLAATRVPAPQSIAVDPGGVEAGLPAHLMSWLPGRLELHRCDDSLLTTLSELLLAVHTVDPGPDGWPREYQSWAWPEKRIVPPWSSRPELWRSAFEALAGPEPEYEPTFLHRDFHVGNVLWQDGAVSGLVDWVETSTGPAGLDVAHCTTALALLHGVDVALEFPAAYAEAGGRAEPKAAYWQVMDVVGFLPHPDKVTRPWREAGRDIPDAQAEQRLEELLDRSLAAI